MCYLELYRDDDLTQPITTAEHLSDVLLHLEDEDGRWNCAHIQTGKDMMKSLDE